MQNNIVGGYGVLFCRLINTKISFLLLKWMVVQTKTPRQGCLGVLTMCVDVYS